MAEPSFFLFWYGRRARPKKTFAKGKGGAPLSCLCHRFHRCAASGADDGFELDASLDCVSAPAPVTGREVVEGECVVMADGLELGQQAGLFIFALHTFTPDTATLRAISLRSWASVSVKRLLSK